MPRRRPWNPYYDEWRAFYGPKAPEGGWRRMLGGLKELHAADVVVRDGLIVRTISGYQKRDELLNRYSFAVPNERALRAIARHGPVIEVGAGNGYWARCLLVRDVDVIATDLHPGKGYGAIVWGTEWHPVQRMDAREAARLYPERTLLMVWPPHGDPMAANALRAYEGETIAYVGESVGGCTATDSFFNALDAGWWQVSAIQIPQWEGVRDELAIYRRKKRGYHRG